MPRKSWTPGFRDLLIIRRIQNDPSSVDTAPQVRECVHRWIRSKDPTLHRIALAALQRKPIGYLLPKPAGRRGRPRKPLAPSAKLALLHKDLVADLKYQRNAMSRDDLRKRLQDEGLPEKAISAVLRKKYSEAARLTLAHRGKCSERKIGELLAEGRQQLRAQKDALALLHLEPWLEDALLRQPPDMKTLLAQFQELFPQILIESA